MNETTYEDIKNNKIVYVAMPYTYNPNESYIRSLSVCKRLFDNNIVFFSPILHTHNFDLRFKND